MRGLILLFVLGCLSACETSSYYSQLAAGQRDLLNGRESIEALLENPDTPKALRERLLLVKSIRDFASAEIALPDNESYRDYVDLERPYAVWNVYAAQEFSATAKEWCFPIAGCVAYRGYFEQQKARDYARGLSEQGVDSFVGGVAAYSTLGWFDDPVLNTFINRDDARLAGLVFHELAHQQLYLPGDTSFNESFARAVEIEGVRRWLSQQQRETLMADYLLDQKIHEDFVDTLMAGREELVTLYAQELDEEEKRRRKLALLERIQQQDYQAFKQRWGGTQQFDSWMAKDFNNAKLATLANYHQWLPAFVQLLKDRQGDFKEFYKDTEVLSRMDRVKRDQHLQRLSQRWSAKLVTKPLQ
jgi:predicted aminopeptidase